MNKMLILFVSCILTTQFSIAQKKEFIGGLLLNFNGIEFKGDEASFWRSSAAEKIDGTLGSSAGIFVKRYFSKNMSLTFELTYIKKGSIYEFISQYGTQAFETLNLNYLELPLLFGYKIKPVKTFWYCEFGLAYAKLISSNIASNDLTTRLGTPKANDFKNHDFSWIVDLKFPVFRKWEKHFLFGLRMSRSILPMHHFYKLYNFDYGVEMNYVFNKFF